MLHFTRKEIKENYFTYEAGYCELQYLLRYKNAIGNNLGIYGWNCDIYIFDDIAIVTGYRPFGQRINPELTKKYEQKANKIANNYELSYEQRKRKINNLLNKFIEEVTK